MDKRKSFQRRLHPRRVCAAGSAAAMEPAGRALGPVGRVPGSEVCWALRAAGREMTACVEEGLVEEGL